MPSAGPICARLRPATARRRTCTVAAVGAESAHTLAVHSGLGRSSERVGTHGRSWGARAGPVTPWQREGQDRVSADLLAGPDVECAGRRGAGRASLDGSAATGGAAGCGARA